MVRVTLPPKSMPVILKLNVPYVRLYPVGMGNGRVFGSTSFKFPMFPELVSNLTSPIPEVIETHIILT